MASPTVIQMAAFMDQYNEAEMLAAVDHIKTEIGLSKTKFDSYRDLYRYYLSILMVKEKNPAVNAMTLTALAIVYHDLHAGR